MVGNMVFQLNGACCILVLYKDSLLDVFLGTMEDGQHLTFTFWGLLGWSNLGTFVLVDFLEFTIHAIII